MESEFYRNRSEQDGISKPAADVPLANYRLVVCLSVGALELPHDLIQSMI